MGRIVQSGLSRCDRATDEVARTAEEYDERNRRKTHGTGLPGPPDSPRVVSLRNGVIADRMDRYQSIGDVIDQLFFPIRFLLSSFVRNLHLV